MKRKPKGPNDQVAYTPVSDETIEKVLRDSGFPFQKRVLQEIEAHSSEHEFGVLADDIPWELGELAGSVDLVLARGAHRLLLDCKRAGREESNPWVFLTDGRSQPTTRARCYWRGPVAQPGRPPDELGERAAYNDMDFEPVSDESDSCAITGSKDRRDNLIERIARNLLRGAVAISEQERHSTAGRSASYRCVYVPVIVTTADLHVASVTPDNVSLADGRTRNAKVERIDIVRFRKGLEVPTWDVEDLRDAHEQSQRTVFVVRGSAIVRFLTQWRLVGAPQWPEMQEERR